MDEKTLSELLECSICFFRLKDDSRVLPCQHTFCYSCLVQVASRSSKLQCPECRQYANMKVEDLPKNVLLIRLLENMKKPHSPTPGAQQVASETTGKQKETSQTKEEVILVPYAKALFDFPGGTKEQLTFKKGENILLQKKIDQIWYLGQIHNRTGLFPINHVQVVISLPGPQCKALYDFRMGANEKEGCLEFRKGAIIDVIRRVDQNWAEGKIGERIGIFPLSFVELNPEGHKLVNEALGNGEVRAVPATVVPSNPKPSVNTQKNPQQEGRNIQRTSPPQPAPKPTPVESLNKMNVVHPEDPRYQGRFVAIYPYKPQKKDELELKKGSHYYITEKCQDGWCKGYSSENPFINGMFPGNYVMPIIMFQLMMARRAMALNQQQSSNQQSAQHPGNNQNHGQQHNACYTNPIVMTVMNSPPELPPRNINRGVAPKQSPVDQKKKEEQKVPAKKETMSDMFKKQWSKYNKRSHPAESSGEDCVDGSFSMDNPVFEDLPSPQHQKPINKNLIDMKPVHMRSGSCPSQLLNTEVPRNEEKKNLPPTSPRNVFHPGKTAENNKRHSANLNVSSPGPATSHNGNSEENPRTYHRKANSLDLDALDMNPKNGQRPKSGEGVSKIVTKERFRCVTPYPPNSRIELELAIGDIILVHRKRETGWYKGQNQRTGLSGIFPASFVEPCQEPIILDI